MFAVQTDDGFDKGDIMRCTLAYGAKILLICSRDKKWHGRHESSGAFHAGRYSKVAEMLQSHSGDSYFWTARDTRRTCWTRSVAGLPFSKWYVDCGNVIRQHEYLPLSCEVTRRTFLHLDKQAERSMHCKRDREREGGGGRERESNLPDVPYITTVSRCMQGNPPWLHMLKKRFTHGIVSFLDGPGQAIKMASTGINYEL